MYTPCPRFADMHLEFLITFCLWIYTIEASIRDLEIVANRSGQTRKQVIQSPDWMTDEQRLLDKLLRGYDPASRPIYEASKSVNVGFQMTLIQISQLEWVDERLQWDPRDYNNLSIVRIPCDKLWLPDIVLYNSADDYTSGYMQSKAMVHSYGKVFWSPPAKLRSACKIDITYFPFDDQSCMMKFGSWAYDGWQVNISKRHEEVDMSNYVQNGEWGILKVLVERHEIIYPCCQEPYPDLRFTIYMRRRTLYYLFNIIFPCLWLTVLSLVSFWLPPDSGEKITLGITVLLAFSVFMLLVAENMPATSEFVPLIGIYLTVTMAMTSLSIILTVGVLQIHHRDASHAPLPDFVHRLLFDNVAPFLRMSTIQRYQMSRRSKHLTTPATTYENNSREFGRSFIQPDRRTTTPGEHYVTASPTMNSAIGLSTGPGLSSTLLTKYFPTTCMNQIANPTNLGHENSIGELNGFHLHESRKGMVDEINLPLTERMEYQINLPQTGYRSGRSDEHLKRSRSLSTRYRLHREADRIRVMQAFNFDLANLIVGVERQQGQLQSCLTHLRRDQLDHAAMIEATEEWKMVAAIVDRLLFWSFLLVATSATIVILIILPLFKPNQMQ